VSEIKFKIYSPMMKLPYLATWKDIDPQHYCVHANESCIYLKAFKGEKMLAVEFGFSESQGRYVSIWGNEPHNPESHAGRFYLDGLLTLKKLAG
jgi:hypothetical protein